MSFSMVLSNGRKAQNEMRNTLRQAYLHVIRNIKVIGHKKAHPNIIEDIINIEGSEGKCKKLIYLSDVDTPKVDRAITVSASIFSTYYEESQLCNWELKIKRSK